MSTWESFTNFSDICFGVTNLLAFIKANGRPADFFKNLNGRLVSADNSHYDENDMITFHLS